jgi:hypothetical protein
MRQLLFRGHGFRLVEGGIYLQHIHPRLTQQSEGSLLGVLLNNLSHLAFAQTALVRSLHWARASCLSVT